MKKCICLFIVCVLISGIFTPPSYAFLKDTVENTEASVLLSNLGIITLEESSEFVTRGEYADNINKLLRINGVLSGYTLPYIDVVPTDLYYNSIFNLYGYKIISSAQNFRPADNITANEAVKIAISALGYDYLAQSLGGYPTGYYSAATKLGIEAKSGDIPISRTDVYEIMSDMLMCKLSTVTYGDEINFHKEKGATLLETMWNIKVISGTIDDAQYFGKNYDKGVGEGYTSIGGIILKKGIFDTDSMFGEYVDAYYDMDTNVIMSVYSHADDNSVVKVQSYQEIEFDNGTYSYYDDNDRLKTKDVSSDSLIIYNGRKAEYDEKIMNPEHGYVKFVSNGKNDSDIIIIKSYKEILVEAIIPSEYLVADKLDGTSYILDEPQIVFTNQSGNAASFSDIQKNSALWIARDADGTIQEVKVCNDAIAGELTGKNNKGIVYLDDREFQISDYAKEQIMGIDGGVLTACLNPDGEIICFILDNDLDSDMQIGYLIRSMLSVKGLYGQISVKLLKTDGNIETFTMADTFTVNGLTFKESPESIYEKLPKQTELPSSMPLSIVAYKTNSKGKLTTINYPDDIAESFGGKKQSLFVTTKIEDAADKYITYSSYYLHVLSSGGSRIFPTLNTKRFLVPNLKYAMQAQDEDYSVIALASDYLKQSHVGYSTIENDLISSYLVSTYELGSSVQTVSVEAPTYMVKSISNALDDDGIAVEKISLVSTSNQEVNYYSKEIGYLSKFNLSFGDVIKVEADDKGIVYGITVLHHAGTETLSNESSFESTGLTLDMEDCSLTNNVGMGTLGLCYILLGNVYKKSDNAMLILPNNIRADKYNGETLYGASLYKQNVLVCDMRTETIEVMTPNEAIKDYETFGNECSKVFVETRSGQVIRIYVYK